MGEEGVASGTTSLSGGSSRHRVGRGLVLDPDRADVRAAHRSNWRRVEEVFARSGLVS